MITWLYKAIKQRFVKNPIETIRKNESKTHEEIYEKTIQFYKSMSDEEANKNIVSELYNKDDRKRILEVADNPIEKQWQSRILMENTKNGGNILMYYNCFKSSFAYYSDTQLISNKDLYYAAMKYVVRYRCRDFLIDTDTYPNNKMIDLLKEEDKQMQTKTMKQTNGIQKQLTNRRSHQQQQKEAPKPFTTKFVRMGKICEFNISQKPANEKIEAVNKMLFNNNPLTVLFDELDIPPTTTTTTTQLPNEKPLSEYAAWKKKQQENNRRWNYKCPPDSIINQ
jgi:hypothetical protein